MEEMLGQKMRPPIVLATFLSDFKKNIDSKKIPYAQLNIQEAMELLDDEPRYQLAVNNCDLEQLYQSDDNRISQYIPGFSEVQRKSVTDVPREAHKLQSLKKLLKCKETAQRNPFERSQESYKTMPIPPLKTNVIKSEDKLSHFNDLLVTVRLYRPARATHMGRSLEKPVFAEEFECLGTNFLTELRDKIACICNKHRFFDISNNPNAELPIKTTDPGYFFITDTFYNDTRNPGNLDYSETIRTWAKHASGLQNLQFQVAKMEETRFLDLTVSLGFPQLYQHHGNCEHVFIFSQVELLTPAISPWGLDHSHYPRLRSLSLYNKRLCHMCGSLHFVFIVEHSDRQLHDPAYLCAKCFYSFHYVDGKKIGAFKAYRVNDICVNGSDEDEPIEDSLGAQPSTSTKLEIENSEVVTESSPSGSHQDDKKSIKIKAEGCDA